MSRPRKNKPQEKKPRNTSKPVGRDTLYTPQLGEEVCRHIAEGLSLRKIEKIDGMPSAASIYSWLIKDANGDRDYQGFLELYTRARGSQAERMVEEILEISDDDTLDIGFTEDGKPYVKGENIQRSKLKVETRKWLMSKFLPRKYGERAHIENRHVDKDGNDINVTVTIGKKEPDAH